MLEGTVIAFISSLLFGLLGYTGFSSGSRGVELLFLFMMLAGVMLGVLLLQTT
jgi:hypothetical protein